MHRVFVPPEAIRGHQVIVNDPAACHHLRDVLRVRPGDRLECCDGQGRRYVGPILRASSRELVVAIERADHEPPPPVAFTLAQALIKPQRFEWVIQKATELGVAQILPLYTARTMSRPVAHGAGLRGARWQRIAREAAAQCGRATIPLVGAPRPFAAAVEALGGQPALMLTLADEGLPLREAGRRLRRAAEATIFIGPEGDFTPEEIQVATRHGVCAVRLQHLILRSETAAIAALAILQHTVGSL